MDLKPIKTKKIYEEIVEQIRGLMTDGDLKPGDQLLSERELAERLRVSRASVREALRALEMMGYIEIRSGEGTFVREISLDDFIRPLAMVLTLEKGSFFYVYEVRRVLESSCAYLAAQRASSEDVAKMETALRGMEEDLHNNLRGDEADTAFHYAVAEATHNPVLFRLMNTISDSVHNAVQTARRKIFETPGNGEKLLAQHSSVLEAIRRQDSIQAREKMKEHLEFAEEEMAKELEFKRITD